MTIFMYQEQDYFHKITDMLKDHFIVPESVAEVSCTLDQDQNRFYD